MKIDLEQLQRLSAEEKRELLSRMLNSKTRESQSYPMSFAQQRLWFMDQLSPDNPFYNVETSTPIDGPLDVTALKKTVNEIVRRHAILRTTFRMIDGALRQIVANSLSIKLNVVDLQSLPKDQQEREVRHLNTQMAREQFDLQRGPLLRTSLLKLTPSRHLYSLTMHHIICDGWSMGIFGREMQTLYKAFASNKPSPLQDLPIQYGDFATWQKQWFKSDGMKQQLVYWKKQLEGLQPLQVPTDRPRPTVQNYCGAYHNFSFSQSFTNALIQLGCSEGATLFMTLLAGFMVLLHRYSGQEDIVVGTYIANRNRAEIEDLIGFFLNTLVLRCNIGGKPTFRDLIRRVRSMALSAYAHQDLPFDKLVEELQPERDLSRNPLFQVTIQLQNAPTNTVHEDPTRILDFKRGSAIFDIALMLFETPQGLNGQIEYSTELFDAETIERIARHFEALLTGAVADPDAKVWQLPLETVHERERLLMQWNATTREVDFSRGLVELFEEQTARSADAVAFSCEGTNMSYEALNRRANQLAHHLVSRGVEPSALVGVCIERSLDLVVALLGILKAGAVYLPLDPSYPQERLGYMLVHAKAQVLVTRTALAEQLPVQDIEVVSMDDQRAMIAAQSEADPGLRVGADALVYVMYTSGSTGTPKGMAAAQRQVLNRLAWMWDRYPFQAGEVCCQKTAVSFVDSLWELLGPLLKGVPTVIVSDEVVRDPQALVEVLGEQRVTRLWVVPSLLLMILDSVTELSARLPLLRFWVSSGETLTVELLQRFKQVLPKAVLYNLYGTSEVWDATWYEASADASERSRVPIGTPIANVQTYVLDGHAQLVPVGVPGELYVAGLGLAEGYLHQEELTHRHFIRLPFLSEPAVPAYRTGDLVRYLPNGDLEYLGRIDQQLKVRGYRVEPGEVEAVLVKHPQLRQVVVLQGEDVTDRLIAYMVPEQQAAPTTNELRRWLLSKLPDYMVPSAFVIVDTFPLTPSGKIDRKAVIQYGDH